MARNRKHVPPTQEDIRLITQCKEERERLREELAVMRKLGKAYKHECEQIRREISELTDASLAEKFEFTRWTVQHI